MGLSLTMDMSLRGGLGGVSIPSWVQPGAVIDEDFANNRYWPRPVTSELVDTRASVGYAADASGNWSSFLSTVLRITNAGLTNEPTSTNPLRNNSMAGAVVGTPGTLPTNWGSSISAAGTLAWNVIATGTESGINYIDLQLVGTSSGAGAAQITFEGSQIIAALNGQVWEHSLFNYLIGGSISNVSPNMFINGNNSSGGYIQGGLLALALGAGPLGSSRQFQTFTMSNAGVAYAQPGLYFSYSGAVAINITVRIGWPVPEQNAVTTPIVTSGSGLTRAADAITIQRTGIGRIVFTFSDNSQQTISGITTGSQYTLPTNLNRAVIKRMTGYAA